MVRILVVILDVSSTRNIVPQLPFRMPSFLKLSFSSGVNDFNIMFTALLPYLNSRILFFVVVLFETKFHAIALTGLELPV